MAASLLVREWLFGGILVCAFTHAGAQAPTQPDSTAAVELPTGRAALAQLVDSAGTQIGQRRNVVSARATLDAIVDGPAFERLHAEKKADALYWAAVAAHETQDTERALALMRRATERAPELAANWIVRFHVAINAGEAADALASLTRLLERWPQMLPRVSEGAIEQSIRAARELPTNDAELHALSELFELRRYHRYLVDPSYLWHRLSLLLLARGDAERALEVFQRVTDTAMIVRARADRRFDSLRVAKPEMFDAATAAARAIERTREVAEFERASLRPILDYARALSANNRCQDALALTERTIAQTAGTNAEQNPFRDSHRQLPWLFGARMDFARCLGRWDDAVRYGIAAARLPEGDEVNVSQALNLAGLYVALSRPEEALSALDSVGGRSSGFGDMQGQGIRLAAYAQLGDVEGMRRMLALMADHRNDAIGTYQDALLLAGDRDGAAAVLIGRLEDADERADALHELQEFAETPRTPIEQERIDRRKALTERVDVRDAIDRVRRIETYSFLR